MRYILLLFFVAGLHCMVLAQQPDQVDTAQMEPVATPVDSIAADTVKADSVLAEQDTVKETRKERRARVAAEKEQEKYYYNGIKKDSARLEIERLSRVAWKRSLILPGWGQHTNKGLWWVKVPVIYGGFVGAYLVFDYWHWYYTKFLNELAYRVENNNEGFQDPDLQNYRSIEGLVKQKDYARRNRDLTILVTAGWWGLNVVEAYVDSMLKNRWDIGTAITMKVSPTLLPSNSYANRSFLGGYGVTPGVKLTMNLN
ncbi:DUF5683 domain-containing protein [Sphingobacterium sp. JB170]|uniref:DUF5683 domain-containing protein n=1 Tax=Sphingobacterium sp. JB170 TaxID=1434842 RepID=UPI00097F1B1C|nr:DUF5683 domain-containing protein [Sphingobacterium sp. JB170]SJN47392.1 hypothetical protein FM107_15595 [Sphingobacterium sp. JB170]